jgi:hypothetical protein
MPDEKAELLGKILDALYLAEFGRPQFKAHNLAMFESLIEQASKMSGKSPLIITEAILAHRYPKYRKERLAAELPSVPPKVRDQ